MQPHEAVTMALSVGSALVTGYFWLVRNRKERPRVRGPAAGGRHPVVAEAVRDLHSVVAGAVGGVLGRAGRLQAVQIGGCRRRGAEQYDGSRERAPLESPNDVPHCPGG